MPKSCSLAVPAIVDSLESRRLMTFAAYGRELLAPGNANEFASAVAPDGSFYIAAAVTKFSPSLKRNINQLILNHFNASGAAYQPVMVLSKYLSPGSSVSIDTDPYGTASVVFEETRGTGQTLQYNRVGSGGIQTSFTIATVDATQRLRQPVISVDQSGGFFVGYVQTPTTQFETGQSLLIDHFADGDRVARSHVVAERDTSDGFDYMTDFDLATNAAGTKAVYALRVFADDSINVRYGIVDGDTRTFQGSLATLRATAWGYGESVAVNDNGTYQIAYITQQNTKQYASVARFDASNLKLGEQNVGTGAIAARIAAMPDGGFAVATITHRGRTNTLRATRFTEIGTVDLSSPPTEIDATIPASPQIDTDAAGNAVVAFVESAATQINGTGPVHIKRFATQTAIDGKNVYVFGTAYADAVALTTEGSRLRVSIDGTFVASYRSNRVKLITIDVLGSNDQVNNNTEVSSVIFGGDGNDNLGGGSGNDSLYGGADNDRLFGGGGDDFLNGGYEGVSSVSTGIDSLYGGNGNDTAVRGEGDLYGSIKFYR